MSQIELNAHQLLRPLVQVQVDDASRGVVRAILDRQIQGQFVQFVTFLVTDEAQFHLVVVVALGLLDVFLFAITIVTDVVG